MSFWIELYCRIRSTLYCISLTFKYHSKAVVVVGLLGVARKVVWNSLSVLLSCHLSVCLSVLGVGPSDFYEFLHGARNPYESVCDRAKFFGKTFLALKIGEMGQKELKNRVLSI